MKAIGIVRQLDKLGRIVLPKELRKVFHIDNEDSLEIFVEEDRIILKKYVPSCIFCSNDTGMKEHNGKFVCQSCIEELSKDESDQPAT